MVSIPRLLHSYPEVGWQATLSGLEISPSSQVQRRKDPKLDNNLDANNGIAAYYE